MDISWLAPAAPMMIDCPQLRCAHFQCRTHDTHVPDALDGVINTPACRFDDDLLNRLIVVFQVNAVHRTKGPGKLKFIRIGSDSDNAASFGLACTLDHHKTDTAKPKYSNSLPPG